MKIMKVELIDLIHIGHKFLKFPYSVTDPSPPNLLKNKVFDKSNTNKRLFIIEKIGNYYNTLSAMLRGCVAQPRLARTLQGTESSKSFSMSTSSKLATVLDNRELCSPFCSPNKKLR